MVLTTLDSIIVRVRRLEDMMRVVYTRAASGGSSDHATLTNLVWTASAHTGTASRFAVFDASGNAGYKTEASIDHDILTNFVANEHIDHTTVTFTAGNGLTGGGDISANRTFSVGAGTGISVSADAVALNITTATVNMLQQSIPDSTGDAFYEPYRILATNDNFGHLILRCGASNSAQPTVKAGIYGCFRVPENYSTSATLIIEWTSTITSGDVVWDFDYRAIGGDDTESMDQATYQESVTVTDTAPSAAHEKMTATINLTSTNFAVGDLVEFFFGRDGADANDTLAGSALLQGLYFEYTVA